MPRDIIIEKRYCPECGSQMKLELVPLDSYTGHGSVEYVCHECTPHTEISSIETTTWQYELLKFIDKWEEDGLINISNLKKKIKSM